MKYLRLYTRRRLFLPMWGLSIAVILIYSIGTARTVYLAEDVSPRFEVASIRQCSDDERIPPVRSSPGRLSLSCWPLRRIIQDAYDVFSNGTVNVLNPAFPVMTIENLPTWVNSVRYSINARTSGPEGVAMMRGPIMQRLLEARFRLRIRRETRDVPAYLMTVAEGGAKLQRTAEGSCNALDPLDPLQDLAVQPGGRPWCVIAPPIRQESKMIWDVKGMSMGSLAKLTPPGLPVIDRTGLEGTYAIHLEWWINDVSPVSPGTREAESAAEPPGTPLITALRKQLGLRLENGRGPAEFLVIEHLEKPSEN